MPGVAIAKPGAVPIFPVWWNWELSFTRHAEGRMAQRGVAEVDVRAMLERASSWRPSGIERRYLIDARHEGRPWVVIVEPIARQG